MRLLNFKEVIGNTSNKNIVMKSLVNKSFPQFSINYGNTGTGKSTMAEIAGLRLICENPNGAEPCCNCDKCRAGIASIHNTGQSRNLNKINLASLPKEELPTLITKLFKIDNGDETVVFIIEEAQVLKKYPLLQTSLLEELERIPPNVYIIMCTTSIGDLSKDIRGRALEFSYSNLSPTSSEMLINKTCDRLCFNIDKEVKSIIKSKSRGCPRKIVNTLTFIRKNINFTKEDIQGWLGGVSYDTIRLLFKSYQDTSQYMRMLDDIMESSSVFDLINSVKEYLMECCFLAKDISFRETNLSAEDKRFAKQIGLNNILKIYELFRKINYRDDESDIRYAFLVAGGYMKSSNSNNKYVSTAEKVIVSEDNRSYHNTTVENKINKIKSSGSLRDLIDESKSKR